MFVLDSSTGINYSVENTWNDVPWAFNDGASGYSANGLFQTFEMDLLRIWMVLKVKCLQKQKMFLT